MKCCGEDVQTAYCPDCGARNSAPPTLLLLRFLRSREQQYEKRYQQTLKWAADPDCIITNQSEREGRVENWRRKAEKWRCWADAVEELINKHKEHPDDGSN